MQPFFSLILMLLALFVFIVLVYQPCLLLAPQPQQTSRITVREIAALIVMIPLTCGAMYLTLFLIYVALFPWIVCCLVLPAWIAAIAGRRPFFYGAATALMYSLWPLLILGRAVFDHLYLSICALSICMALLSICRLCRVWQREHS